MPLTIRSASAWVKPPLMTADPTMGSLNKGASRGELHGHIESIGRARLNQVAPLDVIVGDDDLRVQVDRAPPTRHVVEVDPSVALRTD
jgi:hypothetical protein